MAPHLQWSSYDRLQTTLAHPTWLVDTLHQSSVVQITGRVLISNISTSCHMYIEISEEYAVMVADDVGHLSAKFAIHT